MNIKFPSQEELLKLGLDAVSDDMDKSENSFIHQAIAASSIQAHEFMIRLEYLVSLFDLENMFGETLDIFIYDRTGLKRNEAIKARGEVTFLGQDGVYIPQHTKITNGSEVFETIYGDVIKDGSITIEVEAVVPGNHGDFPIGNLNKLVDSIVGVELVQNTKPITSGTDPESDKMFRARYRDYMIDYPTTNNPAQFRAWAKEVSGVGQARIKRAFNGPGTIQVIVLNSKFQAAEQKLLNEVKSHITQKMGFDVKELSVIAPEVVPLNLELKLTLFDGYDEEIVKQDISNNIKKNLEDYPDPNYIRTVVSYWDIATLIKQTKGVKDIVSLKINGGQSNIELKDNQVAHMGVIT